MNQGGPRAVSRRTTLRAGAHAAWAVPVITVAAAAPAFATSGTPELVLDSFSAAYAVDRADQLVTSFVLRNAGSGPASDLTFTFVIPPGLYEVAPNVINAPSGWIALSTLGTAVDGWQVRWFRPGQLGAGMTTGNEAEPFRIQFLDPLIDAPYRRWAGDPFQAQLLVQPLNLPLVTGATDVLAAPTYFSVLGFGGSFQDAVVHIGGQAQNVGPSSSGPVTLKLWWNPQPGHPAYGQPPASVTCDLGPVSVTGTGSAADPYVMTVSTGRTATRASYPPDGIATEEEIATTLVSFSLVVNLAADADVSQWFVTVESEDSLAPVVDGYGWLSTFVADQTTEVRPGK